MFSFITVKKSAKMLKESHVFYLKKLLLFSNGILFISLVKILQMCYVIVSFLLEVDSLLSWTVDDVTAAVKKVGAKDSIYVQFSTFLI